VLASAMTDRLVDDAARRVFQAPKPEPRIIRYELTSYEWATAKPILPNKPRGVPRVNDRRVLNGIFRVLQSGAPWRDLPDNSCQSALRARLEAMHRHVRPLWPPLGFLLGHLRMHFAKQVHLKRNAEFNPLSLIASRSQQ
jgi:hypothetical protein